MNEKDKAAFIEWLQNVLVWEGKNGQRQAVAYGGGCPMNVRARELLNQFRPKWGDVTDRILNKNLQPPSTFLVDLIDLIDKHGPHCIIGQHWDGSDCLMFCNAARIEEATD